MLLVKCRGGSPHVRRVSEIALIVSGALAPARRSSLLVLLVAALRRGLAGGLLLGRSLLALLLRFGDRDRLRALLARRLLDRCLQQLHQVDDRCTLRLLALRGDLLA